MGWLTDIFKDIPLSVELREKLATVEAESDALKTDNVILKDDLREARGQILTLKNGSSSLRIILSWMKPTSLS
jgi:hypothetical protein